MLKALLLDLDETLCDTTLANNKALEKQAEKVEALFPDCCGKTFAHHYINGIYRNTDSPFLNALLPITDEQSFRLKLIKSILKAQGVKAPSDSQASELQLSFDDARTEFFDFFPGIKEWLVEIRSQLKLIVITNGPAFSQTGKVERVNLSQYVDGYLIGGLEPEQKPAVSIFNSALAMAGVSAVEAIHIGDSLSADIQGAINSGIKSVWVQHQQPINQDITPDYTIKHPSELPELIDRILLTDQ